MQPFGRGGVRSDPEFERLRQQVQAINRRLGIVAADTSAASPVLTAKRFRIACKTLGLTLAGVTVNFDAVWSSPMPSDVYNVDVACSALLGMPTVTVSNQTKNGCTVSFVTPLIATNAVVIAFGVSPL